MNNKPGGLCKINSLPNLISVEKVGEWNTDKVKELPRAQNYKWTIHRYSNAVELSMLKSNISLVQKAQSVVTHGKTTQNT